MLKGKLSYKLTKEFDNKEYRISNIFQISSLLPEDLESCCISERVVQGLKKKKNFCRKNCFRPSSRLYKGNIEYFA